MTDYERLVVTKSDGVGWLILDRPDAGNAFDAKMLDELESAWADLEADPEVRVIVNTANGKSFCTGMDVKQVARHAQALPPHTGCRTQDFLVALRRVEASDRRHQRRMRRRRAASPR
jgi:enoyl-CoA hydratase/carnithine racemase